MRTSGSQLLLQVQFLKKKLMKHQILLVKILNKKIKARLQLQKKNFQTYLANLKMAVKSKYFVLA